MHVADQIPDGGDLGRAERQLAGRGIFYAHLFFQRRHEHPVALPQVQRVWVEQVFRDVEQAQALRTGAAPSGRASTREQVLRGVTDVAAGDEPLHTLDVPGAVGLRNRLGAPRADVGTRVGFGQRLVPIQPRSKPVRAQSFCCSVPTSASTCDMSGVLYHCTAGFAQSIISSTAQVRAGAGTPPMTSDIPIRHHPASLNAATARGTESGP